MFHSTSTIAWIPLRMLSEMKEVACTGALSAPFAPLSLLILSGIERKKKVNTQAAPALFSHFTLQALISLQHSNASQSLVFVSEAFLHLSPHFDSRTLICLSKPSFFLSLSLQLPGGFSSSFSSLACGTQLYQLQGNVGFWYHYPAKMYVSLVWGEDGGRNGPNAHICRILIHSDSLWPDPKPELSIQSENCWFWGTIYFWVVTAADI